MQTPLVLLSDPRQRIVEPHRKVIDLRRTLPQWYLVVSRIVRRCIRAAVAISTRPGPPRCPRVVSLKELLLALTAVGLPDSGPRFRGARDMFDGPPSHCRLRPIAGAVGARAHAGEGCAARHGADVLRVSGPWAGSAAGVAGEEPSVQQGCYCCEADQARYSTDRAAYNGTRVIGSVLDGGAWCCGRCSA